MNKSIPRPHRKPPNLTMLATSNRQSAFSLLELAVVICGLLLLSSVALPVLAKSKNRSPAAGCLSNLRQLQAGALMYSDDHNGVMMPNALVVAGLNGWIPPNASESL